MFCSQGQNLGFTNFLPSNYATFWPGKILFAKVVLRNTQFFTKNSLFGLKRAFLAFKSMSFAVKGKIWVSPIFKYIIMPHSDQVKFCCLKKVPRKKSFSLKKPFLCCKLILKCIKLKIDHELPANIFFWYKFDKLLPVPLHRSVPWAFLHTENW